MPFSLITILVSIQSSEKVGSLLSLYWFALIWIFLFCFYLSAFWMVGRVSTHCRGSWWPTFQKSMFQENPKCYIWKERGKYSSVCLIWVHFEWMVHRLKGEIPPTAKGADGLHLKRVCFKNVTFENSKFQ